MCTHRGAHMDGDTYPIVGTYMVVYIHTTGHTYTCGGVYVYPCVVLGTVDDGGGVVDDGVSDGHHTRTQRSLLDDPLCLKVGRDRCGLDYGRLVLIGIRCLYYVLHVYSFVVGRGIPPRARKGSLAPIYTS